MGIDKRIEHLKVVIKRNSGDKDLMDYQKMAPLNECFELVHRKLSLCFQNAKNGNNAFNG